MVAPRDEGDLVRSLVRVPGSGKNITADTSMMDLGRVSSMAASVPISPLPDALRRRNQQQPHVSEDLDISSLNNQRNEKISSDKRKYEMPLMMNHRALILWDRDPLILDRKKNPSFQQQLMEQIHLLLRQKDEIKKENGELKRINSILGQEKCVTQITSECNELRLKNSELNRKLSLFQQLFKDKRRLTRVVKRLGINVIEI